MTSEGQKAVNWFRRLRISVCVFAIAFGAASRGGAQESAGTAPRTFEVASIRVNRADVRQRWQVQPGGVFVATHMPVRALIRLSFGSDIQIVLPREQVVGGPDWLDSTFLDIEAKTGPGLSSDSAVANKEIMLMLRSLLADRLKVVAHTESRELPTYELVLNREDGRLGPQITPSTVACADGPGPVPVGTRCGLSSGGPGVHIGRSVTMADLALFLGFSPATGRVVRDLTGLTGRFDIRLEFPPPLALGLGGLRANPDAEGGVTVFTALQEQLGLKLRASKGPADVLVIDQVEPLADAR
jgi:uncharacterized protein (TIGR03435 family)